MKMLRTRGKLNGRIENDKQKVIMKASNLNLNFQLTLLLTLGCLCIIAPAGGAVVRPTIFTGLNPNSTQATNEPQDGGASGAESNSNQATNLQQQQQQANLQSNNLHHQQAHPHHAISSSESGFHSQSTKIQPQKSRFCTNPNGVRYDSPLGMQTLTIDDLALSASSYSNEQVGPHLARLNQDVSGGAWCPVNPISYSNSGKEWIQVQLNRSYVVNAIETQGRFGMGNGKQFTPNYHLEYSRNNGLNWHRWKDFRGSSLLRGNEDTNSVVKNELSPPIVGANMIRILPYSQHLRTVCLRFELHGCLYDEGAPIAYETNDGVVEPRWGHLIDYTYDGLRLNGYLSKGLGQLVDGVKGPDNFSLNAGFEWVGWKSMNGDVVIEFTFKTLRNFTGALFHSNNLISAGVEVFQAIDVQYGIDVALSMDSLRDNLIEQQRRRDYLTRIRGAAPAGSQQSASANQLADQLSELQSASIGQPSLWSSETISIEYEPDKKVENSRPVTVHLKNRLANKLKFTLKFASKWILLSEVEFLSHPVELLSLATSSEQQTIPLMAALSPAKTYDEYIAILRENQLRRIATNAFLQSVAGPQQAGAGSAGSELTNSLEQQQDQQETLVTAAAAAATTSSDPSYQNYFYGQAKESSLNQQRKLVSGPAIPIPTQQQPQLNSLADQLAKPATNPILSQVFTNQQFNSMQQQTMLSSHGNALSQANLPEGSLPVEQVRGALLNQASSSKTIGLATVISFVLVTVLILIGLLFAITSYKLKQSQARKSGPYSPNQISSAKVGLQNFMSSVFASATEPASSDGLNNNRGGQNQNLPPGSLNYNSIFAGSKEPAVKSKLKKFASLANGRSSKQPNQLLVSIKDSPLGSAAHHHTLLYNGQSGNQLIVGLNQANPLAQQQIYNNSHCNNSNQTYATHYSTSMSMASSSTIGGHQSSGDYAGGDYAIPDLSGPNPGASVLAPLVPIGGGANGNNLNFTLGNHQYNQKPGHLLGYQTGELRASQRAHQFHYQQNQLNQHQPIHQRLLNSPQQATLIQTNQQQQPQHVNLQQKMFPTSEHNYELIYHDSTSSRPQTVHSRTLSNQLNNPCQQMFDSMTLHTNRPQFAASQHQFNQLKRPLDQSEESSPGGSSQTTASTSVNSSGQQQ